MELSCLLKISRLSHKIKDHFVVFIPYNKSFIDQASLVKMAGYCPPWSINHIYFSFWKKDKSLTFASSKYNTGSFICNGWNSNAMSAHFMSSTIITKIKLSVNILIRTL